MADDTRVDRIIQRIKNNRILSIIIVLAIGIIALATLITSLGELKACAATLSPASVPSKEYDEARKVYMKYIYALQHDDPVTYFATYMDVVECWYNMNNVPVEKIKDKKMTMFLNGLGRQWAVQKIEFVEESPEMVILRDKSAVPNNGKTLYGDRIIVMRKLRGRWRIAVEVDQYAHKCFRKYY